MFFAVYGLPPVDLTIVKALVYFEIVTTAALFIGLAVVNFTKPGLGVTLTATNTEVIKTIRQSHPKTLVETIVHAFASSASWPPAQVKSALVNRAELVIKDAITGTHPLRSRRRNNVDGSGFGELRPCDGRSSDFGYDHTFQPDGH